MKTQEDLDKERKKLDEIRAGGRGDVEHYEKQIKIRKRIRRFDQLVWVVGWFFSTGFVYASVVKIFDSELISGIVPFIWFTLYGFRITCPPDNIWKQSGNS